jgi:alkylhydroperoxidase family enzyme
MCSKTFRLLVGVTVLAIGSVLTAAQTTVEPPGSRQPVALAKARIAPLPEAQWSDVHRQLAAKYSRDGRADNALKTMFQLPELVDGLMPLTTYVSEESSLSPRHRALLALRVAWLCANQPLWATYATRARKAGITTIEIRRIAEGPDAAGWDPFEATLLRLADQLYRNSSVTDATWQALAAGYDLFHQLDAVETVNHFTVLSLVYNSFGVQPDADMPDRLPRDVPYRVVVPPREPALTTARILPNEGPGLAVTRTFAKYPQLQSRWSPRQNFVNRVSKLSPRHREMLILRIGWNCRSEYEWAQHVGVVGRARDHGLEPVRIAEGATASGWDELERTLLRVPDELYRDGIVSDATWRALSDRFDSRLVMSAVVTPSAYRAISMSLNTYGVQLAPTDERFPTQEIGLRR